MSQDSENTTQGNDEAADEPLEQLEQAAAPEAPEEVTEEVTEEPAGEGAGRAGPVLSIVPVEPLEAHHIRCVIEAALLAADDALTIDRLLKLFVPGELADESAKTQIGDALAELAAACEDRGFELKKVASGYRMQVRQHLSPWVSRLWEEKPPRYTRALLETMALIAYRQPATRGDIEEVRGVTVSSNIMRTLLERGWIREVGHRDVPGRPAMYGTTREFLDYFNLSSLDELPSLPEIRELVEPASSRSDDVLDADEEARSEATRALLAKEAQELAADQADFEEAVAEEPGPAEPVPAEPVPAEPVAAESVADELVSEEDTPADALRAVPGTEGAAPGLTDSAPVFADNEVLVVTESVDVEVKSETRPATQPSAEARD